MLLAAKRGFNDRGDESRCVFPADDIKSSSDPLISDETVDVHLLPEFEGDVELATTLVCPPVGSYVDMTRLWLVKEVSKMVNLQVVDYS